VFPQLLPLGARAAGTAPAEEARELLCGALREAGIVDVSTQAFPLVVYEPDKPRLMIDGISWAAGPCMYSQPTPPVGVEGRLEFIGVDRFLPGLFEPHVFAILDEDGSEVARLYGNPIEGGGAGAFAASTGPTLTGPAAYVSNADSRRLRDQQIGVTARLVSGGVLRPGVVQKNILGVLPGHDPRSIVISAHYDSAWGSPGAIDNATGVEGVLRLAEEFAARDSRPVTLVFALFAAEEAGLAGSRAFVNQARIRGQLGNLVAIVNLDSIGTGQALTLLVGPDTLKSTVERAVERLQLRDLYEVIFLPPGPGSDHFPFVSEGVPGLTLSFFPYPDYHLQTDVASLLDPQRLERGVDLARVVVEDLVQGIS
jgi:Peptidase family M28